MRTFVVLAAVAAFAVVEASPVQLRGFVDYLDYMGQSLRGNADGMADKTRDLILGIRDTGLTFINNFSDRDLALIADAVNDAEIKGVQRVDLVQTVRNGLRNNMSEAFSDYDWMKIVPIVKHKLVRLDKGRQKRGFEASPVQLRGFVDYLDYMGQSLRGNEDGMADKTRDLILGIRGTGLSFINNFSDRDLALIADAVDDAEMKGVQRADLVQTVRDGLRNNMSEAFNDYDWMKIVRIVKRTLEQLDKDRPKRGFLDSLGDIRDGFVSRVRKVGSTTKNIYNKARSGVSSLLNRVSNYDLDDIADVIKSVPGRAAELLGINKLVELVRSRLGSRVDDLSDSELTEVVEIVEKDIQDKNVNKRNFWDAIENLGEGFKKIGTQVEDTTETIIQGAKTTTNNLIQGAKQDATNVYSSLSKVDIADIGTAIRGAVNSAGNKVKDVLGITALSKLVRSQMGPRVSQLTDAQLQQVVEQVRQSLIAQVNPAGLDGGPNGGLDD